MCRIEHTFLNLVSYMRYFAVIDATFLFIWYCLKRDIVSFCVQSFFTDVDQIFAIKVNISRHLLQIHVFVHVGFKASHSNVGWFGVGNAGVPRPMRSGPPHTH